MGLGSLRGPNIYTATTPPAGDWSGSWSKHASQPVVVRKMQVVKPATETLCKRRKNIPHGRWKLLKYMPSLSIQGAQARKSWYTFSGMKLLAVQIVMAHLQILRQEGYPFFLGCYSWVYSGFRGEYTYSEFGFGILTRYTWSLLQTHHGPVEILFPRRPLS